MKTMPPPSPSSASLERDQLLQKLVKIYVTTSRIQDTTRYTHESGPRVETARWKFTPSR